MQCLADHDAKDYVAKPPRTGVEINSSIGKSYVPTVPLGSCGAPNHTRTYVYTDVYIYTHTRTYRHT